MPHQPCSDANLGASGAGFRWPNQLNAMWSKLLYIVSCCQNSERTALCPHPMMNMTNNPHTNSFFMRASSFPDVS